RGFRPCVFSLWVINLGTHYSAGFAASPRKPCSAATTWAPSPIAPPTRLTDPERTSPTANTPGTEVSSEAAAVDRDAAAIEPVGGGIGADEQEQVADLGGVILAAQPAAPAHPLERSVFGAFQRDHLGVEDQFDIRRGLDALDQVARHAGAEAAAADDHVDLAGVARQKHRRLACGVAAADQHDLLLRAQPR